MTTRIGCPALDIHHIDVQQISIHKVGIDNPRVVAAEVMIANPAVRSVIREGKTHQLDTIIQTGADQGMQTMDRTLVKLIQQGVITYDDAREYAVNLEEFERLARG
jgi:twitching motility protein PilT